MNAHASGPKLTSTLADDPDMVELVDLFVRDLPERVNLIEELWSQSALSELQRVAHQLKGASGGYGFPTIGAAAGEVEAAIVEQRSSPSTNVHALQDRINELLDLCKRAIA